MPPLDMGTVMQWMQNVVGYLQVPLAIIVGVWVGSTVFVWIRRMLSQL